MNKLYRYIIAAIITAMVLFVMWFFSSIVKYILISAVLSIVGKPLVDKLCRLEVRQWKFPKWLAATVVLLVMWGFTVLVVWLFVPLIMGKINSLGSYDFAHLTNIFSEPITKLEQFLRNKLSIELNVGAITFSDAIQQKLSSAIEPTISSIGSIIDKLSSIAIGAFSISFITFFFLKESNLFSEGLVILFPSKFEENVKRGLNSSINLLSRYFIGLIVESAIKLVVITPCLYFIVGIPFADSVIIALITAVLNVIPYIGPLLGGIIGIVLGATVPGIGNVGELIFQMVVILSVFQVIDNIIIQPYVYSSSVRAHPLEIFLVILAAGSIAGVMGMLLAIPAYTVIRVFAKEFFNNLRVVQKLTEKI